MKKKMMAGVLGVVMVLSAGVASAETHRDNRVVHERQMSRAGNIEQRIDRQEIQIKRSVRRGAILRREAAFLKDNIFWIKRSYRQALRDRRVDRNEWRRLNFMLERNERIIRCLKDTKPIRNNYR